MGGHAGGVAGVPLAVKTLQQYFKNYWQSHVSLPTEDSIRGGALANQAIYELNQRMPVLVSGVWVLPGNGFAP